jgi:hypothetical protein
MFTGRSVFGSDLFGQTVTRTKWGRGLNIKALRPVSLLKWWTSIASEPEVNIATKLYGNVMYSMVITISLQLKSLSILLSSCFFFGFQISQRNTNSWVSDDTKLKYFMSRALTPIPYYPARSGTVHSYFRWYGLGTRDLTTNLASPSLRCDICLQYVCSLRSVSSLFFCVRPVPDVSMVCVCFQRAPISSVSMVRVYHRHGQISAFIFRRKIIESPIWLNHYMYVGLAIHSQPYIISRWPPISCAPPPNFT